MTLGAPQVTLELLHMFGAMAARLSLVTPPPLKVPSPPNVNPGHSQLVTPRGPRGTKPREEAKPRLLPALPIGKPELCR